MPKDDANAFSMWGLLQIHIRKLTIAARMTGVIIGRAGMTIKALEEEHEAFIHVPMREQV